MDSDTPLVDPYVNTNDIFFSNLSTKDASDRQQFWGREAPRDPGYDGVSGRPCSLAEMAIPDAVVRRHATNKVVICCNLEL